MTADTPVPGPVLRARVESLWLNPAAANGLQGRLIEVEGL